MIKAIIYTSNTGTTQRYAKLLGEKTGLPVYSLNDSASVADGTEIIYLGWLMASVVKGYKKAAARFKARAVVGVGMGETGTQIAEVKKANAVPEDAAVFTARGGFDIKKLHGVYKFMMTVMKNIAGKQLAKKTDRTPDEDVMLDMMQNGGDYVTVENLKDVLDWYEKAKG